MQRSLLDMVEAEEARGEAKWSKYDQIPDNLISAAVEELGEVAHAINHNEGVKKTTEEISHVMGILSRLYEMVRK